MQEFRRAANNCSAAEFFGDVLRYSDLRKSNTIRSGMLAEFVKETAINRGKTSSQTTEKLFAAGYNGANLVDVVMVIGDKILSNYLHRITQIPVDFPAALALQATTTV